MEIDTNIQSLPVYEALASDTRLKIINLLGSKEMNISEIASHLQLSNAIITRHIQKLEEANLIQSKKIPGKSGMQKIVKLRVDTINIKFPEKIYPDFQVYTSNINVGLFTDFEVKPTCGLATDKGVIGKVDEPRYFLDNQRFDASLLWFSEGFVEYKIPNPLQKEDQPELVEISLELSSEFPVSNNVWPSDISIYINDRKIGIYTVPGNYSDIRGKLTPKWWDDCYSQYGLLKHIRINKIDTGIDGEKLSDVTIDDLRLKDEPLIKLRLAVESNAKNPGGLTLFGEKFGNHKQNIKVNLYYS